jgi:hypothetical protein
MAVTTSRELRHAGRSLDETFRRLLADGDLGSHAIVAAANGRVKSAASDRGPCPLPSSGGNLK